MKLAFLLLLALLASAAGVSYTYDAAGRLVKVDYSNGSTIAYTYDKAGNLTSRQVLTGQQIITSVNTAGAGPDIAQNTWIEIKGSNLVPTTTPASGVIWNDAPEFASGQLPTKLGGVSVTVNGKAAFVYFFCSAATSTVCTSDQINVLTPLDNSLGPVQVVVTNGGSSTPPFTVNLRAVAPSFLLFSPRGFVVATHVDSKLLGPTTLFPTLSTPAQPGETVVLYAVGFGLPASPLVNGSTSQSGVLAVLPACQVGGASVTPSFAGLIGPGLYQLNLAIPTGASNGDNSIGCTYNGSATPTGDLITVQK
jgi:uncharacterized protein (TIGR03437 family)